jgi:hypothetical protein
MNCRSCSQKLENSFIDLGFSPPSNSYLNEQDLSGPEIWYPLRTLVCKNCWLVQTEDFADRSVFFNDDYAYFSSYSDSWLTHCSQFASAAIQRFSLDASSKVIEVASNDGYLLKFFKDSRIPCLGIEPTLSTAQVAIDSGIETIVDFFSRSLGAKLVDNHGKADLIVANNVLAHVPDLNDFVSGCKEILKETGSATFEFPYLVNLINYVQFDTIYHEHYSYFTIIALKSVFERNGLKIYDADLLKTHGGSLRIYVTHLDNKQYSEGDQLLKLVANEVNLGVNTLQYYEGFTGKVLEVKNLFIQYLLEQNSAGKRVVGFGAAAKGNTLMNFSGIRSDLILAVGDSNPAKSGHFLPGSHIPIVTLDAIIELDPDVVIIFPWNIKDELMSIFVNRFKKGVQVVTFLPKFESQVL